MSSSRPVHLDVYKYNGGWWVEVREWGTPIFRGRFPSWSTALEIGLRRIKR